MLPILPALARRRWFIRWPVKLAVFAAVCFVTLYPSPTRLTRHLQHIRNLEQLTDPDQPALAPMREAFLHHAEQHQVDLHDPESLIAAVEAFVYEQIPYAWDWETWGVADYLPSIAEIVAMGREDCDGRAVLAAALLRSFDMQAALVADPRHVWVRTPTGDLMNPLGTPAFEARPGGVEVHWATLIDPAPLAFGVAVFPFIRELIILLSAWLLILPAGVSAPAAVLVLACLLESLILVRLAGANANRPDYFGLAWAAAHWPLAAWVLWRHRSGLQDLSGEPGPATGPAAEPELHHGRLPS